MTNDELFDIMRPIVMLVTGVPECILADPNAPSPNGEYAAIRPQQTVGERGQPIITRSNGLDRTVNNSVRRQVACTMWVNFYRGDAMYRASLLKGCNKRSDISGTLFKNKLGWRSTGPVNNLTALQSDAYESRAQISINLWYETTDDIVINSIESVTGSVQHENGETITTW